MLNNFWYIKLSPQGCLIFISTSSQELAFITPPMNNVNEHKEGYKVFFNPGDSHLLRV